MLLACVRSVAVPEDGSPLPPFRAEKAEYSGSSTCGACHPAEAAVWQRTAHAHAMDVLVERQRSHDPRCFRCHVTGFGFAGGFPAADRAMVGCEACHGPASRHVAGDRSYSRLPAGPESCLPCHTWENSPDFTWKTYWPPVSH